MNAFSLTTTGVAVVLGVSFVAIATTGSLPGRAAGEPQSAPCAARLATFDTLDFDVFSNQKWNRLSESHANDIVVTWPDRRSQRHVRLRPQHQHCSAPHPSLLG